MIYFDNAATGGFKPNQAIANAYTVMQHLSANPTRSGHRLALTGAKIVSECRNVIADMFSAKPEKVIFTKNCTESLNMAIFGSFKQGSHVITTVFEHNSCLRPLYALKNKNLIDLDVLKPEKDKDIPTLIREKIRTETSLVCVTACSNVTGEILPIEEIGAICKENSIPFLVDGAQGGGHIPIDMKKCNISMLALAGHKGLCGIMGSGVLILSDNMDIHPLMYGGTGNESFNLDQPANYPEHLEAGTLNLPAIASLLEGVKYIKNNLSNFSVHLQNATKYLVDNLSAIENIKVFSKPNPAGIVSFSLANTDSNYIADILSQQFDIAVRGGFHCAPLMHQYLGTSQHGLVRVSLAVQNSTREMNFFLHAMNKISLAI